MAREEAQAEAFAEITRLGTAQPVDRQAAAFEERCGYARTPPRPPPISVMRRAYKLVAWLSFIAFVLGVIGWFFAHRSRP